MTFSIEAAGTPASLTPEPQIVTLIKDVNRTRRKRLLTPTPRIGGVPSIKDGLLSYVTQEEWEAARAVAENRPDALRTYDQIPMHTRDLLRQAKTIGPQLAGKSVAFVGDIDSASLMLGVLAQLDNPGPAQMLMLDFDERVLASARRFSRRFGFAHKLETQRYNVFDPVPADLVGRWNAFYTNPPYGSHNRGASTHLFIARGQELCERGSAFGCILLPYDAQRRWTTQAWLETERFLVKTGWAVREKIDGMHQYHLDDDPELRSSLILTDAVEDDMDASPYAGRRVAFSEIPLFYGRSISPPYPRYIHSDGSLCLNWNDMESERAE